jgi:hypothetical protein
MKFAADDIHKEFFQKNKTIEFENVFSEEEILLLNNEIYSAISKRLSVPKEKIQGENLQKIFEVGRDLWRVSESLRKITLNRRCGELVHQLVDERLIRIGYDQYFPGLNKASKILKGKYEQFLQYPSSIKDFSSLQGIACGLMIGLKNIPMLSEPNKNHIFPSKAGSVVFLHQDALIPWPELLDNNGKEFYLVVYAPGTSIYVLNGKDPQSRFLMHEGYGAGDRLNDQKNPIIFR